MADSYAGFVDGFRERLAGFMDRHEELGDLDYDKAKKLGAEGAAAAVAAVLWRTKIGDTWDTTTTTQFLNCTRQELHQRTRSGTVLALPGRGTRHFPVWQFDTKTNDVRPIVPLILAAFREADEELDPLTIAAWANSVQPELDTTPEDWILSSKDPEVLLQVAERTAHELAA